MIPDSERKRRPAARILLLDPDNRVLLFRFDPPGLPVFWATPGGAVGPGESFEAAARRELLEETGLDRDCGIEIAQRIARFDTIEAEPILADERYFLVRTDRLDIATAGHNDIERQIMRSWRWFAIEEIAEHDEQIFPEELVDMLIRIQEQG
jgi:8-oxo-dGTP pyrophosphatase MutT (NUDIX family)